MYGNCRWRLLFGLGCIDNPKKIWTISFEQCQWFSRSSKGRYEKPWCSCNALPCIDCVNQKKFKLREKWWILWTKLAWWKIQSLSVTNRYWWLCRAFDIRVKDGVMKGKKKKLNTTLKHKANINVRPKFFYGPFIHIWYCMNLSFCYLDAVHSVAIGVLFVCGIQYGKTTWWHTKYQEGYCK
jgi:hypothetical protein